MQSLYVPNMPSVFQMSSACFLTSMFAKCSKDKHSMKFAIIELQMSKTREITLERYALWVIIPYNLQ